jgi:hypothetical protein
VLTQGDLHQYLKEKGALSPSTAINFALDIARYIGKYFTRFGNTQNFQEILLMHNFIHDFKNFINIKEPNKYHYKFLEDPN